MKLNLPLEYHNFRDQEELVTYVSKALKQIITAINGGISITENLDAKIVEVTFTGASTTVTVSHGLKRIPAGYIVTKKSANLVIFDGNGTNTTEVIYLQASAAGTASLLIF